MDSDVLWPAIKFSHALHAKNLYFTAFNVAD